MAGCVGRRTPPQHKDVDNYRSSVDNRAQLWINLRILLGIGGVKTRSPSCGGRAYGDTCRSPHSLRTCRISHQGLLTLHFSTNPQPLLIRRYLSLHYKEKAYCTIAETNAHHSTPELDIAQPHTYNTPRR